MTTKAGKGGSNGERLLNIKETCARTSWSRQSVYRLMRDGKFPKNVALGELRVAWRESDIAAYVASRGSAKARAFGRAATA